MRQRGYPIHSPRPSAAIFVRAAICSRRIFPFANAERSFLSKSYIPVKILDTFILTQALQFLAKRAIGIRPILCDFILCLFLQVTMICKLVSSLTTPSRKQGRLSIRVVIVAAMGVANASASSQGTMQYLFAFHQFHRGSILMLRPGKRIDVSRCYFSCVPQNPICMLKKRPAERALLRICVAIVLL